MEAPKKNLGGVSPFGQKNQILKKNLKKKAILQPP